MMDSFLFVLTQEADEIVAKKESKIGVKDIDDEKSDISKQFDTYTESDQGTQE